MHHQQCSGVCPCIACSLLHISIVVQNPIRSYPTGFTMDYGFTKSYISQMDDFDLLGVRTSNLVFSSQASYIIMSQAGMQDDYRHA